MERNVVFDLDDTLWPLNKIACKLLNIDFRKINCFIASENKLLNDDEKSKLISLYGNPELWKHISWYSGYKTLMDLERYNAKVWIISNCMNQEVADFKRSFLSKELNIPDNQIILNVSSEVREKKLVEDTYILADDSPFNIENSNATYNIVPNRAWNQSIHKSGIYRVTNLVDIIELCKILLST